MCKEAWQNAYAERINGVIKNQYLKAWVINDFTHLEQQLKRAVDNYNTRKPHSRLPDKCTPVHFEQKLLNCTATTRPKVKLYTEAIFKSEGGIEPPSLLPQQGLQVSSLPKAMA